MGSSRDAGETGAGETGAPRGGKRKRTSKLKPVEADIESYGRLPETPQTRSPVYRLAFVDEDFMRSEQLRGVRLQVELLKPELVMQEEGVDSTVILFGGARIPAPGEPAQAATETARRNLAAASPYYDEARRFAKRVSEESLKRGGREFVVATGGGPGIMEAGNRGADDAGAKSVGFGIVLPREESPNPYVSPDLCFNFHYFAIRKMHFLMRAKAAAIFPGGYGTLDELFEVLTLIQTERMEPIPILLFGKEFWRKIIDFEALAEAGTISPGDLELFAYVDSADEAWEIVAGFHKLNGDEG